MSVYTTITKREMQDFLLRYNVGELNSYEGINEGIENTNYFVDTANGSYVLTVFERQDPEHLPYFLNLMAHVSDAGLPVPHPIADKHERYLQTLQGKPAAMVMRLNGRTVADPELEHCRRVGDALGALHVAALNFGEHHSNKRDLSWCSATADKLLPLLSEEDAELLRFEIRHQQHLSYETIPHGVIHADLFRDNVLFNGYHLTGLIDFYYACDGILLYDLAITVNDWCVNDDGSLDPDNYHALIEAYHKRRPFSKEEPWHWQDSLRLAALRFWLSRLFDKHFPRPGSITHIKEPAFFKNVLLQRKQAPLLLC